MRKGLTGALILSGALFILSSCKDDPDPISGISFEITEQEVTESDGTIKSFNPLAQSGGTGVDVTVKLLLDKAAPDKIVLSYTVSGSTDKTINTTTGALNDFNLNGSNAKATETLIIEKGSTEATLTITVFEDAEFEGDEENFIENVILTLESIVSGPAKLGESNLVYTLNIKEDDSVFFLDWAALDSSDPNGPGDVDLDLIVRLDGNGITSSKSEGTDAEAVFIPAGYPDGTYQMSYPYYEGTSNNVKFYVYMQTTSGTLNGKSYPYGGQSALAYSGVYDQENINKYSETSPPAVVQTIVKSKLNYTSISEITVPDKGSRINNALILNPSVVKNLKLKQQMLSAPGLNR